LSNHASPDLGILNRLLKLFSSCSNFDSKYKNEGMRTFDITPFSSFISIVISDAEVERLEFIAVSIFTHDEQLLELSSRALRITTLVFPIVGFQMIATNFFQSLGMVRKSIILSLSRQILFLLPMLYVLPKMLGADGVWASFPIADSISTIMTIFMLGRLFKKFSMLKDGDDPSILGSNL
jgi:hypothetical protein